MRTVVEVVGLVMNSGAVFVISTSALLTRNLLRVFKRESDQGRREIITSRVCSIVYVAASLLLANSFADVPSAIRFLWNLQPLIGIAFWLGLWWRRANHYGAWASFLSGTLAWGIGSYGFHWEGDAGLPYLISLRLGGGLAAGIVVSLLTRPSPKKELDRFYITINTPIGQESRLERFQRRAEARVEIAR
jgi:Na+/proline symporter